MQSSRAVVPIHSNNEVVEKFNRNCSAASPVRDKSFPSNEKRAIQPVNTAFLKRIRSE